MSFSSDFFAAIQPWRPDSRRPLRTVAISEAGNSDELILCSRGNSDSSFPVAVSFIIVLGGLYNCTWRNFQSSWNVPYWLTFMFYSNDGLSFLFAYLRCSCHNMDLVFYQIALSFVYKHNWLAQTHYEGKKFNTAHLLIEIAFQVTTSWSWFRECQECAKLSSRQSVATLKNLKCKIFWFV